MQTEMTLLTAPRQRLVLRTTGSSTIVETQVVMHDHHSHGWSTVAQHHLGADQVEEMKSFLTMLTAAEQDATAGTP